MLPTAHPLTATLSKWIVLERFYIFLPFFERDTKCMVMFLPDEAVNHGLGGKVFMKRI